MSLPQSVDSSAVQNRWAAASSSSSSSSNAGAWTHYKLPGKTPSQFDYVLNDGRDAMAAKAQSSASTLRQVANIEPAALCRIKFSWKLPVVEIPLNFINVDTMNNRIQCIFFNF